MNALQSKRDAHTQAAVSFFASASAHAEAGDIPVAAGMILKAVEQERGAGTVGAQVLQLIKG